MRGYTLHSDPVVIKSYLNGMAVSDLLRERIATKTEILDGFELKSIRLYYVRQINGEVDGKKIVYYFEPEFIYVVDIAAPRLVLVSVPYQVPTVMEHEGVNVVKTLGRGDGEFPDFKEARIFSGSGYSDTEILHPAAPGVLLIGAQDGVSEDRLRDALKTYVLELKNESFFFTARVQAFDEKSIADRIMAEVDLVRYATLDTQVRNTSGPWWVDRVM